jgi:hypothetical protein
MHHGLQYAGGAFVTLAQPDRNHFWETAEALKAKLPPPPMRPCKDASWTRPAMRVRVRTLRGEEMLRHATGQGGDGLREAVLISRC